MWFKQVQLFPFKEKMDQTKLLDYLKRFAFTSSSPHFAINMGWVAPAEDAALPLNPASVAEVELANEGEIIDFKPALLQVAKQYWMLCLKIEEKLLPASVVNDKTKERIQQIEKHEKRKVYGKEKQALKEDVYQSLLPQAFSKVSKVYAYIDTKHDWLILNTNSPKRTERFISFFKKTLADEIEFLTPELKKISNVMTNWLQTEECPAHFTIENTCVLKDPNKQGRMIRCQQQDLFAPTIQSLLQDGYEAVQLQFTWHDQLTFILKEDFSLQSLKYQDAVIELSNEVLSETKLEQFNADFLIMTDLLSHLLDALLEAMALQ